MNDDDYIGRQAILKLGDLKDSKAVTPLIHLLDYLVKNKKDDWYTRILVIGALEKIGHPDGRKKIKELRNDPDRVVRMRGEQILADWHN